MASVGACGAKVAAGVQQQRPTAPAATTNSAQASGAAQGACKAGETTKLSPAAIQAAAYEKSSAAFDKFNAAFEKLPESQKKELGGQIGAELKKLGFTKDTPEVVRAEQTWMTQARVSAEWAGEKAAAGTAKTGPEAANLGNLYYGGMDYMKHRNEYLKAGGPIGQ